MQVCPNGYQIGHDYGAYMECSSCTEEFNSCASYYKSCIRKADLGSWVYATYQANLLSTKDKKMEAYSCKYCGGWHIGRSWNAEE